MADLLTPKRFRRDELDSVFFDFVENEKMVAKLKDVVLCCERGYTQMNACLLKIQESNARSSVKFSEASCDTVRHMKDGQVVAYTAGSLFSDGLAVLKEYLNSVSSGILALPEDKQRRKALSKLLKCVSFSLTSLTPKTTEDTECDWAVEVAQHLFSQLAVGNKYTIDCHYSRNSVQSVDYVENVCHCRKKDKLTGSFGDNSFGCIDAWHGSVDIWMENLAVILAKENAGRTSEVTVREKFTSHYNQLIAQTIVSSFWQRSQNKELNNFLIPSIGICGNKVIVHFYDSENDVLLQCVPLHMFRDEGMKLNLNTVVFLWLVLNYSCLCSGIPDDMKVYRADFHERVGDFIEKYKNELTSSVHKSTSYCNREQQFAWANECGELNANNASVTFCKIGIQ